MNDNPFFCDRGKPVALGAALDQAEFILRGDEARDADALRCGFVRLDRSARLHVRVGDRAHLALLHEIVECAQRLLDRHRRVRLVQIIEIDVVGPQPLQATLDRLHDIGARAAPFMASVERQAELGGEHDFLAARPEHLTHMVFGRAVRRRRCRRCRND